MTKIRVEKNRDYSIIPNAILRDKRLTPKARFLLIFCLSLSDTWEYNAKGLATVVGTGVDAIKAGLKELEDYGYLTRQQKRYEDGKLGSMEYILRENPSTENPLVENPSTENPLQYNTNQYNTNLIKNKKRESRKKEFVPPTLEEVKEYVASRNSTVDAQYFYDYFTEGKWIDSNDKPVRNWKQKLISWEGNRRSYSKEVASPNVKLDMSNYLDTVEDDFFDKIAGG